MKEKTIIWLVMLCMYVLVSGCTQNKNDEHGQVVANPGCYPYAVRYDGAYYVMSQDAEAERITLWRMDDLSRWQQGEHKEVWGSGNGKKWHNIWSPEIYRIKGKWYVYFEADDGNTDNHQLYVLENPSADPMKGAFTLKGVLRTNAEWNYGIHPSTFFVGGRQYLLWSGWPKRRSDTETQCIYLAAMSDPWTVSTGRVMISKPIYEWERQWINPDGSRSAYPIYVNENPEPAMSADGRHVIVYYSASGCWTRYSCVGMVYARADADLLDSTSWHKRPEPAMMSCFRDSIYGPGDVCVVPSARCQGATLLYETKHLLDPRTLVKQIRMKHIVYDAQGFPVLGRP